MSNAALYIQVLFVVLGSVTAQGVFICEQVPLAQRVPCGGVGIPVDQCRSMGCCYDPSNTGAPMCYTKAVQQPVVVIAPPPVESETEKLQKLCIRCASYRNQGLLGGLLGTATDLLFGDKHPECAPCGRRGLLKRGADSNPGEAKSSSNKSKN
ncbi:trefoil factor 1-like [Pseudophryne corroboree]|uniref:trefoil factor 1-like n=1 Tax=Pseudophryne corroboree TaxID=495146 RepID=UPI0030817949